MKEKDKVFEMSLTLPNGIEGKIRLQNLDNRVVAKIGDVFIDKLSWYRWCNAVKLFDKYEKIKKERGIEGKETPLPPKYLVEILDNGFIEDEDCLQELWAKLLVNWQDPNKKLDKRPIYLQIITSLTPTEVKIMDVVSKFSNINNYLVGTGRGIDSEKLISMIGVSEEDYHLSILNLFRCGCFESLKTKMHMSVGGQNPVHDHGLSAISLTILGLNLMNNIKE